MIFLPNLDCLLFPCLGRMDGNPGDGRGVSDSRGLREPGRGDTERNRREGAWVLWRGESNILRDVKAVSRSCRVEGDS